MIFPVEKEKLVDLEKPGEIIGKVTAKASADTAIPEGVPVIACGSDKGCETVGMGVVDEKMASLSFGTTATVQTTTKKYFEPIRFMPAYPALIPGFFNPEVEIFRGYWMITWFKNEFGQKEIAESEKTGVPSEEILNKLLEEVRPGSLGLMVQPCWTGCVKSKKPENVGWKGQRSRAGHLRATKYVRFRPIFSTFPW